MSDWSSASRGWAEIICPEWAKTMLPVLPLIMLPIPARPVDEFIELPKLSSQESFRGRNHQLTDQGVLCLFHMGYENGVR